MWYFSFRMKLTRQTKPYSTYQSLPSANNDASLSSHSLRQVHHTFNLYGTHPPGFDVFQFIHRAYGYTINPHKKNSVVILLQHWHQVRCSRPVGHSL